MSEEKISSLGLLLRKSVNNHARSKLPIVNTHIALPALPEEDAYVEIQRRMEPKPPKEFLHLNEHHWLTEVDKEGKTIGLVVLQWVPSSRRWCHSGYIDTGRCVNTAHWRYYGICRKPAQSV